YRLWATSGKGPHAIGFLVSCYILGGEAMMIRNKEVISKRFGHFINVEGWWDRAKQFGKDEKAWLDERKIKVLKVQTFPYCHCHVCHL
ncbi:unnamed protein product, partial [marine sediment metagenome]